MLTEKCVNGQVHSDGWMRRKEVQKLPPIAQESGLAQQTWITPQAHFPPSLLALIPPREQVAPVDMELLCSSTVNENHGACWPAWRTGV